MAAALWLFLASSGEGPSDNGAAASGQIAIDREALQKAGCDTQDAASGKTAVCHLQFNVPYICASEQSQQAVRLHAERVEITRTDVVRRGGDVGEAARDVVLRYVRALQRGELSDDAIGGPCAGKGGAVIQFPLEGIQVFEGPLEPLGRLRQRQPSAHVVRRAPSVAHRTPAGRRVI